MAGDTAADVEALVGQIPWTDEPMPDAVFADLCRTAIVYGLGRATRAVQEITRLRHQVSALRGDRREFWLEQAERDIATRAELERMRPVVEAAERYRDAKEADFWRAPLAPHAQALVDAVAAYRAAGTPEVDGG